MIIITIIFIRIEIFNPATTLAFATLPKQKYMQKSFLKTFKMNMLKG